MTKKQILKNVILDSIDKINGLKASDSIEVREMFTSLTKRYRSLEASDFKNSTHYEIYLKCLKVPNDLYRMEVEALTNQEDYATSDNFFQIKMSLMGYIGWLDENY